jgi:hypothetical protein
LAILGLSPKAERLLDAFKVDRSSGRACTLDFSSKPAPPNCTAYTFGASFTFYVVRSLGANLTSVRAFSQGVKTERFILLFDLGNQVLLAVNRGKKEESGPLIFPLRKEEDIEKAVTAIKSLDFTSNILKAHMAVSAFAEVLRSGAEEHFINRGLFSNHYLKDRMVKTLSDRGRRVEKESTELLERLGGEIPCEPDKAVKVLEALGFYAEKIPDSGYPGYELRRRGSTLDAACVVAPVDSLDVKTGDLATPSYQAVSMLRNYTWARAIQWRCPLRQNRELTHLTVLTTPLTALIM